jgi:hypothetical protein
MSQVEKQRKARNATFERIRHRPAAHEVRAKSVRPSPVVAAAREQQTEKKPAQREDKHEERMARYQAERERREKERKADYEGPQKEYETEQPRRKKQPASSRLRPPLFLPAIHTHGTIRLVELRAIRPG